MRTRALPGQVRAQKRYAARRRFRAVTFPAVTVYHWGMRWFASWFFMVAVPFALVAQTPAPAPLACPATLTPVGASGPNAAKEFLHVNIYNGKPGGEEYDLAPDDEKQAGTKTTQIWILKDYRSLPIFARCQYRGTKETKAVDVPAKYQKCTFTFEMNQKNEITGKPEFSCK